MSLRWSLSGMTGRDSVFPDNHQHEQREEFGHLVQDSILRIEAAEFLPHGGIRFPRTPAPAVLIYRVVPGAAGPDRSGAGAASRSRRLSWLDKLTY
jgi:hypothetical protein